jgi:hypothetical protein
VDHEKRTDYATRSLLALSLAVRYQPLKLEEISNRTHVPPSVLEQMLQLRSAGLVRFETRACRRLPAQPRHYIRLLLLAQALPETSVPSMLTNCSFAPSAHGKSGSRRTRSSSCGSVRAVVAAQHILASHPWSHGTTLRVRIGLHTGRGELGGDDYLGIDVNRAARIAAAGHGGQVLLSEATRSLIRHELPDGIISATWASTV